MPDNATPIPSPVAPITDYVAGFITGTEAAAVPADVMHLGKRSVLDGIGLALAGAASHTGAIIRRYLAALGVESAHGCTVIGSTHKVPARFAAFANGVSIHADDYDDTQLAVLKDRVYGLLMHPTAPALPPALALGERDRRSGGDVMTAYHIGVEVECKVAEAILPRHYQHGFHTTGTVGVIGAAAVAAKLLGLDRETTRRALSLGATQAGALRENFGTMTKPRRRRGARSAWVHRVAEWTRSRSRLLQGRGRRLHGRDDRRQARQSVDVRVTRRVDQATSEWLAHAPRHDRDARADRPP